jgi:murein L,D-transpeptidase YcbB/YkuD
MKLSMKSALRGGMVTVSAAVLIAGSATSASAAVGAPYISYGNTGFNVQCVQYALNVFNSRAGYTDRIIAGDGQFGPATLAQVKIYQAAEGLDTDGVVGPATGDRMYHDQIAGSIDGPDCYRVMPTYS